MYKELKDVRVVALLGNDPQHRNTLATLIRNEINVVGVCTVDETKCGIPLKYILKSIKKRGLFIIISQILARIIYLIFNRNLDKNLSKQIYKDEENNRVISNLNFKKSVASNFQYQRKFISQLEPEILIVHTKSWVSKSIREIDSVKYVIGGHPGITPLYRGSHSSFWAIYNDDFSNIGWTTFLLDQGVDTGPVIEQGYLKPHNHETYMSLNLRAMNYIAESQVKAIQIYAKNGILNSRKHETITKGSEYNLPTLRQQIRYWRRQKIVR
tara:strand:- start:39 stop:845 length:807 start_codon:yes stop_codon:yes gene_type:complete